MATVVFDNGNSTGIWSDTANWVGDALPGDADTAQISADCTLDMNDIVAAVIIDATKTLTMAAGTQLTGMTAAGTWNGNLVVGAGCVLTWNSSTAVYPSIVGSWDVNGTSVARVTIGNAGSNATGGIGLATAGGTIDMEYTDVTKFYVLTQGNSLANVRLVDVTISGALIGLYMGSANIFIKDLWLYSNGSGMYLGYVDGSVIEASGVVFGYNKAGSAAANTTRDILAEYKSFRAVFHDVTFNHATRITWNNTGARYSPHGNSIECENINAVPGTFASYRRLGTIEKSTTAKKTGDYGALVTPNGALSIYTPLEISLYLPISSGDNLSVSVYGLRSQMTDDCAEIEIDPEGAWYTPVTGTATMTNEDAWYEFTATRTGAGGTGATGMVRIVLRVKEYEAANYFYWADFTATIGGVDYTVDFAEWSQGVPVASRVVTGGGGTFMPRPIQVGL